MFKVILFLGTVRDGRMCARVGKFMKKRLEERNFDVTVFDPLEMDFPLLKQSLFFYPPNETPPKWLLERDAIVRSADGYMVVSAEYNRCIPAALSNMLDYFPASSCSYKPCSIVTYSIGPGGGSTAGMQLKYSLGDLGIVTPGFMFHIPMVDQAFLEDGTPAQSNTTAFSKSERLINELEWYTRALKTEREKNGLPVVPPHENRNIMK